MINKGDAAPSFELPSVDGGTFRLGERRGRPVVVYFYPKDHTPGCTAEAKAFRDQYDAFLAAGAEVRQAFGVEKTLGVIPGRATFVIDGDGIVRHAFASQLNATRHVQEALA